MPPKKGQNKKQGKMPPPYSEPCGKQPGEAISGVPGFIPPGAGRRDRQTFSKQFDRQFVVPQRIGNAPLSLVEAVNDFHFAMMNDIPRNDFYYKLLEKHVTPDTGVLEIGAGSGLLSMMAAKLGAKWVVAVEGSDEMAHLARENIAQNNLQDKVTVLNMLSTDLVLADLPERPDILVSEIFGTLLLGESALDYIEDVRNRILKATTKIIPQYGVQYAVPIECPTLDKICAVKSWNGIDLSVINSLRDTTSCVFTKKYGFRMNTIPFKKLSEPIPVLTINFAETEMGFVPIKQSVMVEAKETGTAHAMLLYWKSMDDGLIMSTDPDDTIDNFPRDMQWGQALQLLDGSQSKLHQKMPTPVVMEQGKMTEVKWVTSNDHVIIQFMIDSPEEVDVNKE
eukprot:Tbor_TRINITY_DN6592_c0_g1::TRINITY_DN6592_c0_g1_i1::g.7417::m.7417/K11438/PRMT7; type III protein arginine methyltransferase